LRAFGSVFGPFTIESIRPERFILTFNVTWSAYRADLLAAPDLSGYGFIHHLKGKAGKDRSIGRAALDGMECNREKRNDRCCGAAFGDDFDCFCRERQCDAKAWPPVSPDDYL
jgi:hypothetical protein